MRRLILKMSVSVDGFVAGPNRELDWIFGTMDEAATRWTVGVIAKAGAHLMGSRTFQDMAAYWPSSTEPFAAPMNEIPKVVFSRHAKAVVLDARLTTAALEQAARAGRSGVKSDADIRAAAESWQAPRTASGDLAGEIARLKAEPGADLLAHGGAGFA